AALSRLLPAAPRRVLRRSSDLSPGRAASSHGGPMTRPPSERTRLIRSATRRPHEGRRPVNPPVERASTLLNPRTAAMIDPALGPVYGLEGLTVQHELREIGRAH